MQVESITPTQSSDIGLTVRRNVEKPINSVIEKQTKKTAEDEKPDRSAKLAKIQAVFAEHNIDLKFSQDQDTDQIVVELVDASTGEEIRQTPSEVSLKLAAITEKIQGHFIDKQI